MRVCKRKRDGTGPSRRFVSPSSLDEVDRHAPGMTTESEDGAMQRLHLEARQVTGQTELRPVYVESGQGTDGAGGRADVGTQVTRDGATGRESN